MGLFINSALHPDVYHSNEGINEPNQNYFKTDYISERIQEQKRLNEWLTTSIKQVGRHYQLLELKQNQQWKNADEQIRSLKEGHSQHAKFERDAREWLHMLEESHNNLQNVVAKDGEKQEELNHEIHRISQMNHEISERLIQYGELSEKLSKQMEQLVELNQGMSDHLDKQKDQQEEVLSSFEQQEALLEKTYRQLDFVRSALFERTSFLADKIENSYQVTSSLIYKLITGSEKPLTLLMSNQKKKDGN